jgi:hypothetical protein
MRNNLRGSALETRHLRQEMASFVSETEIDRGSEQGAQSFPFRIRAALLKLSSNSRPAVVRERLQ